MAAVDDYTVVVESVESASEALKAYGTDLQYPGQSLGTVKAPAEPKAGVSIVATIKSATTAWGGAIKDVVDEMNGLATMCSGSAKLYHESEETVTRYFQPGAGPYGKFKS